MQYNLDGKTYDDPAQLPPDIRAKVERALRDGASVDVRNQDRTEVRVVNADIAPTQHRGRSLLLWLLVAAIVWLVIDAPL